ncbi:DUF2304 domain-containing protein [Actinomyces sp. zg-332]|uniref:DUF2304 domain-containing protein n=1 Tax=Actinomyces sp. zg-332 TaxID=2708340 RepID=UPI001421C163|nr:DUF2304 domain-containing protein [Actinomyces sp. zg-332]QPK94341.1 DUF2304 domain-containing protein [Actinomyces sp. zg-332]
MKNLLFVFIGLLFFITTYRSVKKNIFSEKESFFWIILSCLLIISPVFVPVVDYVAHKIGIDYPPALLFLLIFAFCLLLIFRLSKHVYIQNEKLQELSQIVSLLRKDFDDKNNADKNTES